jgi:histidine ammonia-lyase
MGANAATKLFRIIDNCYSIMGIELLNSVQAIEFRRPLVSSPVLEQLVSDFRGHVDRLEEDRALFTDMQLAKNFVTNTMKL